MGNVPPAAIPHRTRDRNSISNDVAIAPTMLAAPSSTRHAIISRALPNISAAAPRIGCTMANVKATTADRLAAVAIVTPKLSATSGSTGSIDRDDNAAANVVAAMILRIGSIGSG